MPRPRLFTDDQLLDAALQVLLEKGPSAFTLSDVAKVLGMSRAAIIQRFSDKATLHRKVMERLTVEVEQYFTDAPGDKGVEAVRHLLTDLISGMGNGSGMEGYLLLMWGDVRDPGLRLLAARRNRLVREAIRDRLPGPPADRARTASIVQAVIQGSCMQWLVEPQGNLDEFMLRQTLQTIDVLVPPT